MRARGIAGSADFNLTLINYMEPTASRAGARRPNPQGLKSEPEYGMGKVSVSWHADSSLENHSAIAVYHVETRDGGGGGGGGGGGSAQQRPAVPWRLALRVSLDAEGPSAGRARFAAASARQRCRAAST